MTGGSGSGKWWADKESRYNNWGVVEERKKDRRDQGTVGSWVYDQLNPIQSHGAARRGWVGE